MADKSKIFRDPLYGYIPIPVEYCNYFIDNPIFQRLRRIEQTSMRIVYPSARHDRFSHSLGVFYLGQTVISHIKENSKEHWPFKEEKWNFYKRTFEIACLLHDCGHSPFSHTFEHYYTFGDKGKDIIDRISCHFSSEKSFNEDLLENYPASHELISALVMLEKFKEKVESIGASPLLAARMIMGITYNSNETIENKFENKLIKLLNGKGIDVDSLDYIQRDSWISGVSNVNIDYQRLLSSLLVKRDGDEIPKLFFKKQALSVLSNINIGRNFLYKWIYSHHKVIYEQYLLKKIIDQLNTDSNGELSNKLFSIDSLFEPQPAYNKCYYLPTDDDLVYTIKNHYNDLTEEYFSRKYKYKAVWKTFFEFDNHYFNKIGAEQRMQIFSKINKNGLTELGSDFVLEKSEPKLKGFKEGEFFIDIEGEGVDVVEAVGRQSEEISYFILYTTEKHLENKIELRKKIRALQS